MNNGSNSSSGNSYNAKTIRAMVAMYCRDCHHRQEICNECQTLTDYAINRLQHCPIKETRTTCGKCQIHCYKPKMKIKIQEVMRYAGPLMIKRHPGMAIKHLLEGLKKTSKKKKHELS